MLNTKKRTRKAFSQARKTYEPKEIAKARREAELLIDKAKDEKPHRKWKDD